VERICNLNKKKISVDTVIFPSLYEIVMHDSVIILYKCVCKYKYSHRGLVPASLQNTRASSLMLEINEFRC